MPAKSKTKPAPEAPPVTAIKGFDANLQCRGFQFAIGETYKHDGTVKACQGGFHAVTGHPLAVFSYYAPAGSKFCRVELSGATDTDDNEKTAAEIITVGEEIGLSTLVREAVAWVTSRAKPEGERATGDRGAASATGNRGAASATGNLGAALAAGFEGRVMGADGNALFAVERSNNYAILSVACGIVGREGIEPNVWYRARAGKLVRVA